MTGIGSMGGSDAGSQAGLSAPRKRSEGTVMTAIMRPPSLSL